MRSSKVQINELRLRAPGLNREQAQRLGRLVAKRLSESPIPVAQSRTLPSVSLRVRDGRGSLEGIASEIASSIRKSVR